MNENSDQTPLAEAGEAGSGAHAPLLAADQTGRTWYTAPLRATAGLLRAGADLVGGLAKRLDDRR